LVQFTITFSESVTGVDTADFALTSSGDVSAASVVGFSGSANVYTSTVFTGTGDGTLRLDVIDDDSIVNGSGDPLGGVGIGNGDFTSGENYTIDKTYPSVSSVTRGDANPTSAGTVDFTVVFGEAVTGVDTADFALAGTVSGASVTGISGSGTTYTASVNTGTGDGTLRLDVIDNDSIADAAENPLGGTGPSNGAYAGGESYAIDKTPPTVTSVVRADPNPTNAAAIDFTVVLSENVTGLDATDFSATVTSGSISGAAVSGVSGSGTTFTVTVATGTGDGTLRLDVADDDSVVDVVGNPLGGGGAGNGDFIGGEEYTTDRTPPAVTSVTRLDGTPTNAASVDFTVTFSESVTGVGVGDLTATVTGGAISGAAVSGVSGSGTTYTVTVATGTGDGTLRLDVVDDDSIADALGNALGGAGAGNGDHTGGEEYAVDKTDPTVTVEQAGGQADPTDTLPILFDVAFSETVTGFDTSDVTMGGSATGISFNVTGSGAAYTVQVTAITGDGTVVPTIAAGVAADAATNVSEASTSTDNSVQYDSTSPQASSVTRAGSTPTNAASVDFTVTFSENVTGVDTGDFTATVTGGAISGAVVSGVSGSGTTYTVTVGTGTGDGTFRLDVIDDDSILDTTGNPLGGGGAGNGDYTGGEQYTVDKTPPAVSSITRADTNPTSAAAVDFTVVLSEAVTGVDTDDLTATVTGGSISGAAVSSVSGSGTTFTVTLDTGTGDGTLRLDLVDDDSVVDGAGNPLGGSGAGNGSYTGGEEYAIDKTPPTVTSITRADANPTNAASTDFTVVLSEAVAGVDTGDFTATVTGGSISGAAVSSISGSGTTYTVTVGTGAGDGTLRLDVVDDDTVVDAVGNPLGGSGAGNGEYTGGEEYAINKTPPTVTSITRADSTPSNAASVDFTVTFTEAVTGVDTGDFVATVTGGAISGAAVSGISGSGTTYTVTVGTGTGDGTLRLDLADDDSIADALGDVLGGAGAGNGNYTGGEEYTVDRTAPTVTSITRADADPTNAAAVDFTVTFSESVTAVDGTDFSLTATVTGPSVSGVSGTGTTHTVTVDTGSGDGTLRLDLADDDSIVDAAGNVLGGAGAGNGSRTGDEAYTVDKTAPTVTVEQAGGQGDPTSAFPILFDVTFSESVTGFQASDVTIGGSASGVSLNVAGAGAAYTIQVTAITGDGTVIPTLAAGVAADAATNTSGASTSTDNSVRYEAMNPVGVSVVRAAASPTNAASVDFTVTFSEDVTGVDTADFAATVTGGGISGASVAGVSGSAKTYTVTVGTGTGDGTLRLDVADDDSIVDALGNVLGGPGAGNGNYTGGEEYTIDKTPPTVTSVTRADANPTNAASVDFTVTFTESVSAVDGTDFSFTATVTGPAVSGVSGSGTTRAVTVDTGTGDGTLRLDLVDNDSIVDTAGNVLGGAGAGNGSRTGDETYTVDKTAPTVTVEQAGAQADPTKTLPILFDVTFSESVTSFDASDVTMGGSASGVSFNVAGTGAAYTIQVTAMADDGTLVPAIAAGVAQDAATNENEASTSTDNSVEYDITPPQVASVTRAESTPTNAASVDFTVTFSEGVTGVDTTDFTATVTGGGISGAAVSGVSGSGTTYTVTVGTGTGDGTLRLDLVDDDSIADALVNVLGGAGAGNGNYTGGEEYTLDRTPPTVSSITRADANPTNAASVDFTVTFSEGVTAVDGTDFSFTATVTAPSVSGVSGTGTTRTVAVDTGTGDGTLRLDLVDNDSILDAAGNVLGGAGAGNGSRVGDEEYTVDKTAPTVTVEQAGAQADPTKTLPILFDVTFSESVTGFDASDVTMGGSASGVSFNVAGSGAAYTIQVTAITGDGTVGPAIMAGVATDAATNASEASTSTDNSVEYDITPPTVSSVTRVGSTPTNAASVDFTVAFSEGVTGVDTTDFTATVTGGGISGAAVSGVAGSGATYTVTVDTGTGDGTLRLDVVDDDSIGDALVNVLGGAGAGNGNYTGGEEYAIDKTAPSVTSIMRGDANPTNTAAVDFTVTFSESVTAVDSADFSLTATVTAPSISGVSGSGTTRTVTLGTGTGDGTLRLDLVDDDSIVDAAGNVLGGAGAGNGSRAGDETYTVDKTAPTVTVEQAGAQVDPTKTLPILFDVAFSESVTGFDASDVTMGGSASGVSFNVAGSGAAYTIQVTAITGDGTVVPTVAGGTATDAATNASEASTSTDNSVEYDTTPPAVSSVTRGDANPTNASSVDFTVTFSEGVTGVDAGDFTTTVTGGSISGAAVSGVSGSGTTYTVTVGTGTGDGNLRLDVVDDDSIADALGNVLGGAGAANGDYSGGEEYTIDRTPPTVTIEQAGGQADPTNALPIVFDVTFNEAVAGFDASDVTVAGTATGVTFDVNGSGAAYTVEVDGATGDGTVVPSLPADAAADAAGNTSGASTSADNSVAYDTVAIGGLFTSLFVSPTLARQTTELQITFEATEPLAADPAVTVAGSAAVKASQFGLLYEYTYVVTGAEPEGSVQVAVGGTDEAGNPGTVSTNVTLDLTAPGPPVITATVPYSPSTDQTPVVVGLAEANTIVRLYDTDQVMELGSGQADGSGVFSIASLPLVQGVHDLYARATDGAGNSSGFSLAFQFEVDLTGAGQLFLNIVVTPDPAKQTDELTISFDATEPLLGNPIVVMDGKIATFLSKNGLAYAYTYQIGGSETEGAKLVEIIGAAADGTPGSNTARVVLDFTAPPQPTLTRTVPSSPSNYPTPIVEGAAEAHSFITLYDTDMVTEIGSAQVSDSGAFIITTDTLASGIHSMKAVANDAAGNGSAPSNALSYEVVSTPSLFTNVSITPDPAGATDILAIVFDESEPLNGDPTVTIDGNLATKQGYIAPTYTYAYTVTGTEDEGTQVVIITGETSGGIPGTVSRGVVFDFTAPSAPILTRTTPLSPSTNQTPLVYGIAEAGSAITLYDSAGVTVIGTTTTNGSGNFAVTAAVLDEAAHSLKATADDAAGNTSAQSVAFAYVVDLTAGAGLFGNLVVDPDPARQTSLLTITFDATETLGTDPTVTVGGMAGNKQGESGLSYTYTYQVSGTDAEGTNTVDVNGQDQAGNPGWTSGSVLLDFTNPAVTVNQAGGQTDPAQTLPVAFDVLFSEAVTGFDAPDVVMGGTATGVTFNVSGSGTAYTVEVTAVTGDGTLVPTIPGTVAQDTAGNGNDASTSTDNSVEYDSTAPTVTVEQAAAQADPANALPITFDVVFSESVTGFGALDVAMGGTATGVTFGVSGSGAAYTVEVTAITGDGTVVPSVVGAAANDPAGNGSQPSTSVDNSVEYDTAAPTVTVEQAAGQADPATTLPILFNVAFSESVTGFQASDVTMGGSASGVVFNVSGSGATYAIQVTATTGDGTVIPTIAAGVAIDPATNGNEASTSADNSVQLDSTVPLPVSMNRADSSPTSAASVGFSVSFNEPVTGVDATDFVLTTTGAVSGSSVTGVSGGGTTYTITVATGTGDGTIRLDVADDDSIADLAGNLLGGIGAGNGNFAAGEAYAIDRTSPTVSMSSTAPDPTNALPIAVTVTFSESVTGLVAGDITPGNGTVQNFAGSGALYTFDLVPAGDGLVTAAIGAGLAQDEAGNPNTAAAQFTRTYDATSPAVSMSSAVPDPTNTAPIAVSVAFSEPVTGFAAGDISSGNGTVQNFAGSGSSYSFELVPSGEGLVTADIGAGTAQDGAGNSNTAAMQLTRTYDTVPPAVSAIVRADSDPTNAASVDFTVTFDEPVTGVDTTDFALTTVGPVSGPSVTEVSGSGDAYTVAVATGTGDGTVRLDVTDDDSIADLAGNLLGGAGLINGDYTAGEAYTVDKTPPTVLMNSAAPDPTYASPIAVTVTFSEPVTGFAVGDVNPGNGTVQNVAGSGASYTFDLVPAGDGLVTADIGAGVAQDGAGNTNTAATQFARTYNPPSPPTDLSLSGGNVEENQPVDTVVGVLTTADPNPDNVHTYTLVAGAGDTNNGSFSIVGDQLRTGAVFDFETQSAYSIRVQTDDGNGGTYERAFSITVTGANDAPVLDPIGSWTIDEGRLLEFVITGSDIELDGLAFDAAGLPLGASFDPSTQTFSWTPGFDQAGVYTDIVLRVTDSGVPPASDWETITITVNDVGKGGAPWSGAKTLETKVAEEVLPLSIEGAPETGIAPRNSLAIRLSADSAIDVGAIWAMVDIDGIVLAVEAHWRPVAPNDGTDGWVLLRLAVPVAAGERLAATVGALTVEGEEVRPRTEAFLMATEKESREWADLPYMTEAASEEPLPGILADGASAVYRIGPAGVFEEPLAVLIPVPQGKSPEDLGIYYFSESERHRGWYRGENVTGWIVPDSRVVVEEDGQVYIQIEVNHSGLLQLGQAIEIQLGSVMAVDVGADGSRGQWLSVIATVLLLSAVFAGVRRKREARA
jgi:Bacterial Ig-like domain